RDLCGIARALDVVGERWALLVVRELLYGPKRFADLQRGLPGMSQNVLTQRLRDLEASGVLVRRRGLPPVMGQGYELTGSGRAHAGPGCPHGSGTARPPASWSDAVACRRSWGRSTS